MAAVQRRDDVSDLGVWTAKGVRKFHRELIVRIGLECGYSSGEVPRVSRDGRRISEHSHGFFRRTHCQDSKIPITKKAIVSLSLEIRKNLDWPIGVRAKRGPRLHFAVHISDAVVVRDIRIIPRIG